MKTKYFVDEQLIDKYLKKRLSFSVLLLISSLIFYSTFAYIFFILNFPVAILCLLILFPLYLIDRLILVKKWNEKIISLSKYEFVITQDSIAQQIEKLTVREIHFSEIAVINKKKFLTVIVKGNWLSKLFYFIPKRNYPNSLNSPDIIFIPNITSNYSELIETIQAKKILFKK